MTRKTLPRKTPGRRENVRVDLRCSAPVRDLEMFAALRLGTLRYRQRPNDYHQWVANEDSARVHWVYGVDDPATNSHLLAAVVLGEALMAGLPVERVDVTVYEIVGIEDSFRETARATPSMPAHPQVRFSDDELREYASVLATFWPGTSLTKTGDT